MSNAEARPSPSRSHGQVERLSAQRGRGAGGFSQHGRSAPTVSGLCSASRTFPDPLHRLPPVFPRRSSSSPVKSSYPNPSRLASKRRRQPCTACLTEGDLPRTDTVPSEYASPRCHPRRESVSFAHFAAAYHTSAGIARTNSIACISSGVAAAAVCSGRSPDPSSTSGMFSCRGNCKTADQHSSRGWGNPPEKVGECP